MNDTWIALTKYKLLEDRVNELKRDVWSSIPPTQEVEEALEEVEQELSKLKAWIQLNFDAKKAD